MKKFNKGFTLIELLVVIAIIGILSAIVLASLSSARSKGEDTAKISTLSNMRTQAELYHVNKTPASYGSQSSDTNCGPTQSTNATNLFGETAVKGNLADLIAGLKGTKRCVSTGIGWAVQTTLDSGFACVDSTGLARTHTANMIVGALDVSCN